MTRRILRIAVYILLFAGVEHYTPDAAWYVQFLLGLLACAIAEIGFTGRICAYDD